MSIRLTTCILVLDISGSMKPQERELKARSKYFVNLFVPNDALGIEAFNGGVQELFPRELIIEGEEYNFIQRAVTAIGTISCTGNTNITKAIEFAIQMCDGGENCSVVLLSDGKNEPGGDGVEPVPDSTFEMIQEAGYPFYTCGIGDSVDKDLMEKIAETSPDGEYHVINFAIDMDGVYNHIHGLYPKTYLRHENTYTVSSGQTKTIPVEAVPANIHTGIFSVTWKDLDVVHSSSYPDPNQIRTYFIAPNNDEPQLPISVDEGHAIFKVRDPAPGNWKVMIEYEGNQDTDTLQVRVGALEISENN